MREPLRRHKRLETDPGSLGDKCFGASDSEFDHGEDAGEELFDLMGKR